MKKKMISLIISRNYIVRRKRGDFIKKVQNNEHSKKKKCYRV